MKKLLIGMLLLPFIIALVPVFILVSPFILAYDLGQGALEMWNDKS